MWDLILCIPTPTPIGLNGISFFSVLCVRVNILCEHVQMCVCVCVCVCVRSAIFMDMEMETDNTRIGVATNHREIEGVVGHLYLLVLLS